MAHNSVFSQHGQQYLGNGNIEEARKKLKAIEEVGKEVDMSMSQFALAWLVKNKDVSTAIIGSKKPGQLEENLKAVELAKNITPEIEEKLEKVLGNRPDLGLDWKARVPLKPRRQISTL